MRRYSAGAGFLTSVVLAALTATVFYQNQHAGPEGALSRYFASVVQRDRQEASRLVAGGQAAVMELERLVMSLFGMGTRPVVLHVTRHEGVAMAAVVFVSRQGVEIPWAWRLVLREGSWFVDAEGTLHQFRGIARVPNL